tara:strand:+ start:6196 stop:6684 length:489 start_codon:yes stop_codon:yes gene_type:complete
MNKTKILRIALFQPRIPQNTGNIARTSAAFKIRLDLIKPLGFSLDDKYLKRAGLDYWKYLDINVHDDFEQFFHSTKNNRLIAFSKKGSKNFNQFTYQYGDILLFGREDIGIPNDIIQKCYVSLKIPMPGGVDKNNLNGVRSLNLSVACGIVGFHVISQLYDF